MHDDWVDKITDDFPHVMNVIQGARSSYGDDMGAFLCFMGVRLLEMRRVLKPTGSIYLHCDPTASTLPQGRHGRHIRVAKLQERDHLATIDCTQRHQTRLPTAFGPNPRRDFVLCYARLQDTRVQFSPYPGWLC